jgi:type VI secretion system protein ImpK
MLCLTADEVLAHLPDDGEVFSRGRLMTRFFGEHVGDSGLFEMLDRAKADPRANRALLELCHACLALGFQGVQKSFANAALLQGSRFELFELLQKQRPIQAEPLSAHCLGQNVPSHAMGPRVPFWAVAALTGLTLFALFFLMRISLSQRAETAAELMAKLAPPTPVRLSRPAPVAPPPQPPPTPTQVSQIEHIRELLQPQMTEGSLSVEATANQIIIHITDRVLFPSAKSEIFDDVKALMIQIARALDDTTGRIKVIGHSDNKPIANAHFASNFALSFERARAAAAILKQSLAHPERVEAEGRGADAPLVSNDTVEGRAKNWLVEIIAARND